MCDIDNKTVKTSFVHKDDGFNDHLIMQLSAWVLKARYYHTGKTSTHLHWLLISGLDLGDWHCLQSPPTILKVNKNEW